MLDISTHSDIKSVVFKKKMTIISLGYNLGKLYTLRREENGSEQQEIEKVTEFR
jgi:hypothetical protein